MRFDEAFAAVLREMGLTKTRVAVAAGKANMSALGMMMRRNNPRLGQLMPYVAAAGYRVVLVPEHRARLLPDDCFVVDECGGGGES